MGALIVGNEAVKGVIIARHSSMKDEFEVSFYLRGKDIY